MAFFPSEHSGKGSEVSQALGALAGVAQQAEQFFKTVWCRLGALENLPPLFEPVGSGVAFGQPTVNVVERDTQEGLPGRRLGLLQLVRHQIMQRIHVENII